MSDFIVNEAKFVIDMDDGIKDPLLSEGQILPGGLEIAEQADRAENFQLYEVKDASAQIVAVRPPLMERWVKEGYLPKSAFMQVEGPAGPAALLISPGNLVCGRVTALRAYGSLRYALNFAAALEFSRRLNPDINLRDGLYLELYSIVLPTYSRTREVCDHALFLNVLSKDQQENLSSRRELFPSEINFYVAAADLRKAGYKLPNIEPDLVSGEVVEVQGFEQPITIAGAVALSENFQLYACAGEQLLLTLEPEFAAKMGELSLVQSYELLNLRVGGRLCRALLLSKRQAAETLNDRHSGLTLLAALRLALALKVSRAAAPEADFTDGLYLAAKGVVLPQRQGGSSADDRALLSRIVQEGPFAAAPFDFAELDALQAVI